MSEPIITRITSQHLADETVVRPFRTLLLDLAYGICPEGEMANWVYRGVSDSSYKLQPSLARVPQIRTKVLQDIVELEIRTYVSFRRRALSRLGAANLVILREAVTQMDGQLNIGTKPRECQSQGEAYIWTALMQHSGVPTRFLDWTESPWIALYFAVMGEPERDGVLYALNRRELCERQDTRSLAPVLLLTDVPKISKEVIQVVQIPHAFGRIENQLGLFTVAEDPLADHAPLIRRKMRDEKTFVYWRIPARTKVLFRRYIASMNISPRTLFPELHGLADSVRGEI